MNTNHLYSLAVCLAERLTTQKFPRLLRRRQLIEPVLLIRLICITSNYWYRTANTLMVEGCWHLGITRSGIEPWVFTLVATVQPSKKINKIADTKLYMPMLVNRNYYFTAMVRHKTIPMQWMHYTSEYSQTTFDHEAKARGWEWHLSFPAWWCHGFLSTSQKWEFWVDIFYWDS